MLLCVQLSLGGMASLLHTFLRGSVLSTGVQVRRLGRSSFRSSFRGRRTRARAEGRTAQCSIVLRNGRRIVVRGAFDDEALRRLVHVAETA